MNNSEKISFFDPRNIPLNKLLPRYITAVSHIPETNAYTVHYSDGTTKELPTTDAPGIDTVESVDLIDNFLTVNMYSGTKLQVGDISSSVKFESNEPVGTGLLVDILTHKFKQLKSGGGALVFEHADGKFKIRYGSGGDGPAYGAPPPGNLNFGRAFISEWAGTDVVVSDVESLTKIAPLHDVSDDPASVAWHPIHWDVETLNTLGVTQNAGVMSLVRGQYYIKTLHTALDIKSFVCRVRDVDNDVVLAVSTSSGHTSSYVRTISTTSLLSGDFFLPADTNVVVEYFCATGANVKLPFGGTPTASGATKHVAAQIELFQVSGEETVLDITKPVPTSSYIADLKTLPAAEDKPYTYSELPLVTDPTWAEFYQGTYSVGQVITAKNGRMYLIPHTGKTFLSYDPDTNTTAKLECPHNITGSLKYGKACLVGDDIYVAPMDSPTFVKISITPEEPIGTVVALPIPADATSEKYRDVVYDPITGHVVYIPQRKAECMGFDPNTGATKLYTSPYLLTGSVKHLTGIFDPISKTIFALPGSSAHMTVVDTEYGHVKNVKYEFTGPPGGKARYNDAIIGHDGCIYGIPGGSVQHMVINGTTCGYAMEDFGIGLNTDYDSGFGGAYGADGRYYSPSGGLAAVHSVLDTRTKKLTNVPLNDFGGHVLAIGTDKKGDLYLFPTEETKGVRKLSFGNTADIPESIYTRSIS